MNQHDGMKADAQQTGATDSWVSQEVLEVLSTNLKDVFWLANANPYRILFISKAYEDFFGKPVSTLYANPFSWLDLVHPDDRQRVGDVVEHSREPFKMEFRVVRDDKTIVWVRSRGFPIFDAAGHLVRRCGIATDITELKTAAALVRLESTRKAELRDQREDFLATLTHDLKNPIIGANRVLDSLISGRLGELNEQQAALLVQIKKSNESLTQMIKNLTNVYGHEKEIGDFSFQVFDVNPVAEECFEEAYPMSENRGITLKVELSDEPAKAYGHALSVKRLIVNLLDNAMKFTESGGTVTLSISPGQTHTNLSVVDTGIGISKEDQKHLFTRFWKGGSGGKVSAGTGLGLYFCKLICDSHGGQIEFVSEPNIGTRVTVSLPKAAPEMFEATIDD